MKILEICLMSMLVFASCQLTEPKHVKTWEEEMQEVETETQEMQKELSKYRLKAFNREIEAQTDMRGNWKGFSDKIKDNEKYEEKVLKIEKRLEELQQRKKILLEQKK